jgi:hypothetical protein
VEKLCSADQLHSKVYSGVTKDSSTTCLAKSKLQEH